MTEHGDTNNSLWQKAAGWLRGLSGAKQPEAEAPVDDEKPCCGQASVHIGFRGKADDRMYMAYNRNWAEVRYFQPNGLRVFCAVCRRRLL